MCAIYSLLAKRRPLCHPNSDMLLGIWLANVNDFEALMPFRSVDTPVAKSPLDATARDPPRSTVSLQWLDLTRKEPGNHYPCWQSFRHV